MCSRSQRRACIAGWRPPPMDVSSCLPGLSAPSRTRCGAAQPSLRNRGDRGYCCEAAPRIFPNMMRNCVTCDAVSPAWVLRWSLGLDISGFAFPGASWPLPKADTTLGQVNCCPFGYHYPAPWYLKAGRKQLDVSMLLSWLREQPCTIVRLCCYSGDNGRSTSQ